MLKFIDEQTGDIINIPELNQLREDYSALRQDSKSIVLRAKFSSSVNTFFIWYINYCKDILNGKTYADKNICECIYRPNIKTEKQLKDYLLKSIYVSKEYVEYLNAKINKNNIQYYLHTILDLEIDLEWLIANFESHVKKTSSRIHLNGWRKKYMEPTDIYSAACTLFFIEEYNLEDLYLRDLKPAVMFQIRQLLEMFGKNLIGYYSIVDRDGNEIKKFTQASWDFIKEEIKKPNSRISFPFEPHIIMAINNWSNSFVHTTFLYNSYLQFYALKTIKMIFMSSNKMINIYTGVPTRKLYCADIKIIKYNSLKIDFEDFLNIRIKDVQVKWLETEDVGAYIISL